MRTLVLIASDIDSSGSPLLRVGDRAAVHWAHGFVTDEVQVRHPPGDVSAAAYAAAVGLKSAAWSTQESIAAESVLIGPGATERWGDECAGRLAVQCSAELLFDVLQVERDGNVSKIVCDSGRGAREMLRIVGNLVMVLSEHVSQPPYVSVFRRTRAMRSIALAPADGTLNLGWTPVAPRRKRAAASAEMRAEDRTNLAFGVVSNGGSARSQQAITGTPAVCAEMLLRYLVHHGFLNRTLPEWVPPEEDAPAIVSAPARFEPGRGNSEQRMRGLSPAVLRSPRLPGKSDVGRARRPRPENTVLPTMRPINCSALERGPRRNGGGPSGGERGPFRVTY